MITRGEFFMIKEMYERGMSISDIARELGIGKTHLAISIGMEANTRGYNRYWRPRC
jgi:hypothetical protein